VNRLQAHAWFAGPAHVGTRALSPNECPKNVGSCPENALAGKGTRCSLGAITGGAIPARWQGRETAYQEGELQIAS
jgi:hypothetical protein